jgi:hypothetical protein
MTQTFTYAILQTRSHNDTTTYGDTIGPTISRNASGSTTTRLVRQNAARNASFQWWDASVNVFRGAITMDEMIPDAPRMSPLNSRRVPAARPMRDPPIRPDAGVKWMSDMMMMMWGLWDESVVGWGLRYKEAGSS